MEVFTHPVYIFIHLLIKTNILGVWVLGWVLGVCVWGGGGRCWCWWGQKKVMAVMRQYKKDSPENVISSKGTFV